MVTCRQCESEINQATEICPHCGADLTFTLAEDVSPKKKATVPQILLRWGILLGVLLAAIWSFLWFVVSPRTGQVSLEAETQAVQALGEVIQMPGPPPDSLGGIHAEPLRVPVVLQVAAEAETSKWRHNAVKVQNG